MTECVVRLAELQQAAVFAQFGDESQKTEQQPVRSFLILLLLDLKDRQSSDAFFSSGFKLVADDGANVSPHIFVVVGVCLSLQQRQQVVQATGELLLVHLHEQTTNLSPETPQVGLKGRRGKVGGLIKILFKII